MPFDAHKPDMPTLGRIDHFLAEHLYFRDVLRIVHHFHPQRWIGDESIERDQLQACRQSIWQIGAVQADQSTGHRHGREMSVNQGEFVARVPSMPAHAAIPDYVAVSCFSAFSSSIWPDRCERTADVIHRISPRASETLAISK